MKKNNIAGNPINTVLTYTATIGFLGFIPFAPGTIGSLFAAASFFLIDLSVSAHFFIIIITTLLGVYASSVAERVLQEKDSGKIIIDEFAGFYVAVFYIPKTLGFIIAAFLLFRFFDILKPLFISKIEKTLNSGLGIMADDILAGIYTNLVLQIFMLLVK